MSVRTTGRLVKRRKLVGLLPIIGTVAVMLGACSYVLPAKAGFDEYGYNYGPNLFNGWYGSYDRIDPGGWVPGSGDAWLLMKWSNDWIPMADEPIGAWCTNHWTWYSNDQSADTWYGFTDRLSWTVRGSPPVADYKMTEFLKIMKVGNNGAAWAAYEAGGAMDAGWGTYDQWWILGDWVIGVLDTFYHDIWITIQSFDASTGTFSGIGAYPAGETTSIYEKIEGTVVGATVEMKFTYFSNPERTIPIGYEVTAIGTIDSADGSISGTSPWSWGSTSGHAFQVPQYVVYQDVIDIYDADQPSTLLAHYDLCTASPKGLGQPIF